MKKSVRLIIILFVSLLLILFAIKGVSELIYEYKYKPCMEQEVQPVFDNETGQWTNECPGGCHLGSCFGVETACCPD